MLSVFIFRRDLRAVDNLGFAAAEREANTNSRALLPVFIYNPRQVDARRNPYRCALGVDLMTRCLLSLTEQLKNMRIFRTATSDDLDVLEALRPSLAAVHFNSDVTPFARERDARIAAWCLRHKIECHAHSMLEYCLVDPAAMPKPYRVFSPFLRRHLADAVASSAASSSRRESKEGIVRGTRGGASTILKGELTPRQVASEYLLSPGASSAGRKTHHRPRDEGLAILARIRAGAYANYAVIRDDLSLPPGVGTTCMSALLKFGAISVREAFRAVLDAHGPTHELARQMMWRAYYDQLYYHGLGERAWATPACRATLFNRSKGSKDKKTGATFARWCRGETGVEIVDAAMRELLTTGRMHGRARMIAAVYLARDMGVDWRLGERFFATRLVDYHPSANHGGWRWAAACGADAMPSFRTMNPARQAERHDASGAYRKLHDGVKIPTQA
jgi:deoxyribodipyrimidine photo-lyase